MLTYDRRTIDSTGAFLIGELERLDQTAHDPLFSTTWGRDLDLREDVGPGDEYSSFTNSTFASVGGISPNGKHWVSKVTTQVPSQALDISKTTSPLALWAMELSYTIPELLSAQQLGRPVDAQKYRGIQIAYDMDVDGVAYLGDTELGTTGLANSAAVTPVSGLYGGWTADVVAGQQVKVMSDINALLEASYQATGYKFAPHRLLLPPIQFGLLAATPSSSIATISLLNFISQNCLSNAVNGKPLQILPQKYLPTAGVSNTTRMVAYTKNLNMVRLPLVPMQRTQVEPRGLFQVTTLWSRVGAVELVYPETVAYGDGI
jgi:hypothetical protein